MYSAVYVTLVLGFTAVLDYHRSSGLTTVGSNPFDLLDGVHTFNNLAKHHVLSIQPWTWHSGDEELRPIGVGTSIGHTQQSRLGVSDVEVFIFEFFTVN